MIFFQPQYLQEVLGHGAVGAGLLILPITAPMVFISPFCGPLIERFGPRALMTFGMVCGAVGLALLTRIDASSSYGTLLPGYLLFGISLGLVYAPMSTAAMLAMPRAKAGIAAGVLAMIRVTAGAVALAVVSAVFQNIQDGPARGAPRRRRGRLRHRAGRLDLGAGRAGCGGRGSHLGAGAADGRGSTRSRRSIRSTGWSGAGFTSSASGESRAAASAQPGVLPSVDRSSFWPGGAVVAALVHRGRVGGAVRG